MTSVKDRVRAAKEEERKQYAPGAEPLFSWQGIGRFIDNEPKPQEFILKGCLPARITGAIFATGGVGKTTLALQLSCCLAVGKPFGPFEPMKPTKVLFIGGEDAEDIFHRRLYNSVPAMGMRADGGNLAEVYEQLLRKNLEVVSLVGTDRVLTEMDEAGNPRTTAVFDRLQETIKAIDGLELLIIDPKSRFDGLNENDNAHATFFVACLEKLVKDHNLTVLFSHHESKAQVKDGKVKESSGRGASALRDGVRWALSLGEMSESEAAKFEVEAVDHIEAAISKSNYGPKWKTTQYFRRDKEGVLSPVNLQAERVNEMVEALVKELATSKHQFTSSELEARSRDKERTKAAKEISDLLDEKFTGYKRGSDMKRIVSQAIFKGRLTEKIIPTGKISKTVLIVPAKIRAQYENDLAEENDDEND